MTVNVVIGANYGDEGKGLVTNSLARLFPANETAVVRFNGGAQAGHTVQLDSGHRHVFSHFGSGSLNGAATILSKHFIVNPKVYQREAMELSRIRNELGLDYPPVYVSSECRVTMPTDVWVNRFIERSRGGNRHGSVGLGINETVTRYDQLNSPKVGELRAWSSMELTEYISDLRWGFAVQRLEHAGIHVDTDVTTRMSYEIDSRGYANALYTFLHDDDDIHILYDESSYPMHPPHIIYEGAQGLLLDEFNGDFPYVTRSRTGLTNVVEMVPADTPINVWYVTRAYLTRHGAGPLYLEDASIGVNVIDPTNKPNDWQGSLRFAPLDPHKVLTNIHWDVADSGRQVNVNIVVTCCDQVDSATVARINSVFQQSEMCNSLWNCYDPTGNTMKLV